jgi:hypothetical protein
MADIEEQARAILALVLQTGESLSGEGTIAPDPRTCPNCSCVVESVKSPYCSDACRELSSFVRQFRSNLASGMLLDHEKQVALGQTLWHLLGGGRPLRQSLVPPKALETVLKREGGLCQGCGRPATTIDHQRTACNRTINLRAVCLACCNDRPFGDPKTLDAKEFEARRSEVSRRVCASVPLRCCDDPEAWDWRSYLDARKGLLHQKA